MTFGIPLSVGFIIWGVGKLAHKYNIMLLEIPARDLPAGIAGLGTLFFAAIIFGCAYGLTRLGYAGAEVLLSWIEHKLENRRINRLSQYDSVVPGDGMMERLRNINQHGHEEDLTQAQRTEMLRNFEQAHAEELDEDRAYRERIGVED